MNKACFVLIVAMSPASLFAGETMITHTATTTGKCDFRVDKCETSVATDPSYIHFKDGASHPGPADVGPLSGDPGAYRPSAFAFQDYSASHDQTIEELLALIQKKLSNCPQVKLSFDEDTGDLTLHYVDSVCDCDCDWVVNVRDIKADDFVWKRTTDNYSNRLGQMERRKFHVARSEDAQDIEFACTRICVIKNWKVAQ